MSRTRAPWRSLLDIGAHMPLLSTVLLAPALFFALNPYVLLEADRFVAFHSSGESSIGGQIRGHCEGFFQQFLQRQGFAFFAEAVLAYDPAIALLGIVGAFLAVRRFPSTALLVLIYPLFHYLMFSTTSPSLEQRYMLPVVVLGSLPAGLAASLAGWFQDRLKPVRWGSRLGALLAALLIAVVALASLRYDWLLAQPDTRTLTKEWIESRIPPGSEVAVESYPPPLDPDPEGLRARQQAEPKSLGARDRWILEKGLPEGAVAYRLTRLNLADTSPAVDLLSPYLATHRIRYFVVSDFRWKSDHRGHQALRAYLAQRGRLLATFSPGQAAGYVPSDLLNNLEDPWLELWRLERPGPRIEVYEVGE